ncbi:mucin-5AC-like [Mya arenaria]|uniref:mucin-5AC-like n=1 Tax=Mya arenaria TaxID=6604 RepID=UPI0022DE9D61|nr:mucin-5AC-like [Mya arenaria]
MNFNDLPSPIRTSFDARFVSPYQTSSNQRNAQSRGQAIPARVTSRNTAHPTILRIPLRMPEPSQLPLRPRGMTSGIPRPIPRQGTMARHMKPVANKVLEVTSPRNQLSKRMRFPGPFALHRLPKQPVQEQISRRKQIAIPVKVPISQTVPLSQQNTIQTKSQLPTPIIDSQAKSDVLSLGMANNEFNVKLNILNGAEHTVLNDRTAFSNHGVTHLNIEPLLTDNGAIVLNKEVMHHNNIHVPALPGSAATVSNNSVDTFNIGGQHSNNGGTFSNTGAIHSNIGASPLTNNIQVTKLSPGNDPLFDELVNEFTKALQDSTSLNTHTHAHNGHANTHAHQPLTPTQHLANFHPQTAFAHMQFGGPFGVNPWFMDPAARQEMLFGDTTDPPPPPTQPTTTTTAPATTVPIPIATDVNVAKVTSKTVVHATSVANVTTKVITDSVNIAGPAVTNSSVATDHTLLTKSPKLTAVASSSHIDSSTKASNVSRQIDAKPFKTEPIPDIVKTINKKIGTEKAMLTLNETKTTDAKNRSSPKFTINSRILAEITGMLSNSKIDMNTILAAIVLASKQMGGLPPDLVALTAKLGIDIPPNPATPSTIRMETIPSKEQLGIAYTESGLPTTRTVSKDTIARLKGSTRGVVVYPPTTPAATSGSGVSNVTPKYKLPSDIKVVVVPINFKDAPSKPNVELPISKNKHLNSVPMVENATLLPVSGTVHQDIPVLQSVSGKGHQEVPTLPPMSGKGHQETASLLPVSGKGLTENSTLPPMTGKNHQEISTLPPVTGKGHQEISTSISSEGHPKNTTLPTISGKGQPEIPTLPPKSDKGHPEIYQTLKTILDHNPKAIVDAIVDNITTSAPNTEHVKLTVKSLVDNRKDGHLPNLHAMLTDIHVSKSGGNVSTNATHFKDSAPYSVTVENASSDVKAANNTNDLTLPKPVTFRFVPIMANVEGVPIHVEKIIPTDLPLTQTTQQDVPWILTTQQPVTPAFQPIGGLQDVINQANQMGLDSTGVLAVLNQIKNYKPSNSSKANSQDALLAKKLSDPVFVNQLKQTLMKMIKKTQATTSTTIQPEVITTTSLPLSSTEEFELDEIMTAPPS